MLRDLDEGVADQPMDPNWTPTDEAALKASEMLSEDDTGGLLKKLGIPYDPKGPVKAGLYKIGGHHYLAYRGLGGLGDLWHIFRQWLGFPSSRYEKGISLARAAYDKFGSNVTFVGISGGGGLASAAKRAIPGSRAITFNAVGLGSHYSTANLAGSARTTSGATG